MPNIPFPMVPMGGSTEDITTYLIKVDRILRYLIEQGLDSENIFEVGGWRVTPNQFASKDGMVGMSSAGTDPTSIRFWAGTTDPTIAPFRVQQDGTMYSTKGFIGGWTIGATSLSGTGILEGGTVRTAASGARIEVTNGTVTVYDANGEKTILIDSTSAPPKINFYDPADADNPKASIYLTATNNFTIAGAAGTTISDNTTLTIASPNLTGSPKIGGGTVLGSVAQADSTATDVAGIVSDFNTLLVNLRDMKILA